MHAHARFFAGRDWQIVFLVIVTWLVAAAGGRSSFAGGGPENVFLLVNSASQDSMKVANYYIRLRNIPPSNVFYLPWRRNLAVARGKLFRKEILLPALEEINLRKLSGQIDYLVYSCDFPYRVDFKDLFPGKTPRYLTPSASLTGATYLYAFVKETRKEMFGLNANFYCTSAGKPSTVSRAFRSRYRWAPGGRRAGANGLPYLLSSMLGVTFGRGNTTDEIVHYLTTAAAADHTKPKGTVYFAKNKTVRSTPRHDLYPAAVRELALAGMRSVIVEEMFPKGRKDMFGVTCGTPTANLMLSGSRFLPGAFCDNLTSAGAQFFVKKKQVCVSDFLRRGAAGACGTVIEPTAIRQKFPLPTLHVHYARGCSMAESFYQSVAGPYQQLLVGDPLCQPCAERLAVEVKGIAEGTFVRGTIEMTPTAKSPSGRTVATFELYVDGERKKRCVPGGKMTLDTTKLADGYHELRVVATDSSPLEGQGRWVGQIAVKNGRDAVELRLDDRLPSDKDNQLRLKVASTAGDKFSVIHNGREIGTVAGGSGSLLIDTTKLGSGPVTLFAQSSGDSALRSPPLEVQID